MRAMVLDTPGRRLRLADNLKVPKPKSGEVLIRVTACGVCRTDLHVVDGDLPHPKRPIISGHEIVGTVVAVGAAVVDLKPGDRVGIPWLGWTCGTCAWCRSGRENLCDQARFTGYQIDGGYADHALADHRYCFSLPGGRSDQEAAPLLCAGLIGFRAYRMAGDSERLGIYGFGAAAHLIAQLAVYEDRKVFAFTRPGDFEAQRLAHDLGAAWAGASGEAPPQDLDAALIFAPIGDLVPVVLQATRKGGTVVCAGIHMTDIPSFPYRLLWEERVVRSVANLTRQDGIEFLDLAATVPMQVRTTPFRLDDANEALDRLRSGRIQGAAVIMP